MGVLAVALCIGWGRSARLSDARSNEVVSGLLHNVYRAFDFREEEQIYDVLAKSVEGDLLARIYLETRRGLEVANQGGARAKVKVVELVDLEPSPESASLFERLVAAAVLTGPSFTIRGGTIEILRSVASKGLRS